MRKQTLKKMLEGSSEIEDLFVLKPKVFEDERGWFTETWNERELESKGIYVNFVQDNHSMSKRKGTLRGLHYQKTPFEQAKLIRCVKGSVFDVAVDLRYGSKTYGCWKGIELSQKNGMQFYIPTGFFHGFITLEDNTEIIYKCSNYYSPEHEIGIRFDDPDLCITWPKVDQVTISKKDNMLGFFSDFNKKKIL